MPEYRTGTQIVPQPAEEGQAVPFRGVIDFQGAGVTVSDDPAGQKTIVSIPGGSGTAVYAPLSIPGDLVTSTGIAKWRFHTTGTLRSITADLGLAATTQSVILDVKKNGTSIFASSADRIVIPRGQTFSGLRNITGVTFTENDTFTIDVTQAGTAPVANITPIGWQTDAQFSNVTTFNVVRPTTPATSGSAAGALAIDVGDLLILWMRATTVSGPWTAPPGAGWTQLGTPTNYTDGVLTSQIFWRFDDGSPGPWTFSGTASSTVHTMKWWGRNVDPTAPINTFAVAAASGVPNAPAITTTTDNAGIVLGFQHSAGTTRPAITGYTSRIGFDGATNGTRHLADDQQTTAGTIASFALGAATGVGSSHVTSHIALKPAPVTDLWSPGAALTVNMRATEG